MPGRHRRDGVSAQICAIAAYLAVLTRRASPEEKAIFVPRLAAARGEQRLRVMEDLYWVLVNSTEFSWNH